MAEQVFVDSDILAYAPDTDSGSKGSAEFRSSKTLRLLSERKKRRVGKHELRATSSRGAR